MKVPTDLATRLVDEGLINRQMLAEALAGDRPACLVARLVDGGADAEQIAQLFEADHGLLVGPVALAKAATIETRLPSAMAHDFLALVVARTTEFVVVAMSNPSNRHAVREMERALGCSVRPRPARVPDLRPVLTEVYGDAPAPVSAAPIHLTRPKTGDMELADLALSEELASEEDELSEDELIEVDAEGQSEADESAIALTRKTSPSQAPLADGSPSAEALPLSRRKTSDIPAPADAPSEAEAGEDPEERPRPSRTFAKPKENPNSWESLDEAEATKEPTPSVEMGPFLAAIRDARGRDDVARAACAGAIHHARIVVFLTLRRGVLRGWDARGEGISLSAVRNLWIPATSPSMFRDVVDHREVYRGPYGASAADHLYRAAIGSRGGTLEIHPITARGKLIALLCADEPDPQSDGLDILAHAVGEALSRMV